MKVLVACEFSGIVRDAFIKRGHDALSCDLLPTESPGPHYQGDVFDIIDSEKWDLMVAHPPCTYLANSGVCHLYNKDKSLNLDRWEKMKEGANFFQRIWLCDIPKVCVENPIMHKYAKHEAGIAYCYDTKEFKQVIQPWMFGHPEQKATCLWRRGLPELKPTNNVKEEMMLLPEKLRQKNHWMSGKDRQKNRSRTYPGVAEAMAEQWG